MTDNDIKQGFIIDGNELTREFWIAAWCDEEKDFCRVCDEIYSTPEEAQEALDQDTWTLG